MQTIDVPENAVWLVERGDDIDMRHGNWELIANRESRIADRKSVDRW